MDRQILTSFFDELEKIGAKPKIDPIRGRPVEAVATRVKPIPSLPPVIPSWHAPADDLDYLVSQGAI